MATRTTAPASLHGTHYTYKALVKVKVKDANTFFPQQMILLARCGMRAIFIGAKPLKSTLPFGKKKSICCFVHTTGSSFD